MYNSWDEKSDLSWDNVLHKLSHFGPTFKCEADEIEILSNPNEFYELLIKNASNAEHRILISTLYIGEGDKEKHLVSTIENTLKSNKNLKFSMIMDYSRSTRNIDDNNSSLHTLLPLFNVFNNNCNKNVNINLFRTPHLTGIYNYFPERSKEIVGVHHIKAYIFDDKLIISGANLNETYLNNRQDRYFIFTNKEITNHIYNMLSTLNNYCPNVQYNNNEKLFNINMEINMNMNNETINVENEPEKWIDFVATKLLPFTQALTSYNHNNISDTYVVMSTQLMDKIETDFNITSFLLSIPNISLRISTAYFNLAQKYNEILLNTYDNIYRNQMGSVEILTASQKCNSFYNANGLAGYVTPLYQHFAVQFENKIKDIQNKYNENKENKENNNNNSDNLFEFYRYNRPNWTFHGKGIWLDLHNIFSLTMIGSSNYGERSVHRDSELNFTILTKNKSLKSKIKQEWLNLTKYNDQNIQSDESMATPFFVGLLSGLVQHFM
eukprot:297240_1